MKINRDFADGECIKYISGKEFRESGMLWYVNQQLHLFGMALTWNPDTDEINPALVKFRGFSVEINDNGYKNVSNYLSENVEALIKDCD